MAGWHSRPQQSGLARVPARGDACERQAV